MTKRPMVSGCVVKRTLQMAMIIAVSWTSSSIAQPKPVLQEASLLRKMSLHVRGVPPTPAEYAELQVAKRDERVEEFFRSKAKDYLATPEASAKMAFRLQELFKVTTAPRGPGEPLPQPGGRNYWENSLQDLFLRMSKDNLSWDTLLTGKSYRFFPLGTPNGPEGFGRISDFDFIRAVLPKVVPSPQGEQKAFAHEFGPDDLRIAGAVTTGGFFTRYTTTQLNKNRRRAAAIFHVFLCDSMNAVIPPPPENPDGTLDKAFPETSIITEEDIRRVAVSGDRHGGPDCAACHFKLDPMGQVFMTSTVGLAPRPAAGRLTYRDLKTS